MDIEGRRKLENQLIVMGLNRLEDPELIPELAKLINTHPGFTNSHAFYLGMLNECNQEKRRKMYDALRPLLTFDVWPLEKYVMLLKQHAGNVESHGHPYKVSDEPVKFGGNEFREVMPDAAEACLLKLTCYKCTGTEEFYGLTPVQAITVARDTGWVRDLAAQKEICPKCSPLPDLRSRESQSPDDNRALRLAREKRQRKSKILSNRLN